MMDGIPFIPQPDKVFVQTSRRGCWCPPLLLWWRRAAPSPSYSLLKTALFFVTRSESTAARSAE